MYENMASDWSELIARENRKQEPTKISNDLLQTRIKYNKPFEFKGYKFDELIIESYFINKEKAKTFVYFNEEQNQLNSFTKFSNYKDLIKSHYIVLSKLNEVHDNWHLKNHK